MAEYGLGNFRYELTFDGKSANFKFVDPEDINNTAEVSVSKDQFPEGINDADSRQVADIAYAQVAKLLNDKRDARHLKEQADAEKKQADADKQAREAANDFFNKANELSDQRNYEDDFQTHGSAKEDKKKK